MTGNIGREGTGINPMRGQNNIQGAGDCGALPNNYPGFQPVTDPANQEKFEKLWGRKVSLEKGIDQGHRPRLWRGREDLRACSSTARTPSSPIPTASTASTL